MTRTARAPTASININDYGTSGTATALNHGFFAQDAWTLGKGITINAGLRIEREYLPAENQPVTQVLTRPINFGWGDPRSLRVLAQHGMSSRTAR